MSIVHGIQHDKDEKHFNNLHSIGKFVLLI